MGVEFLSWDSSFFKKKIGKCIFYSNQRQDEIILVLEKAKREGYNLISVFGDEDLYFHDNILNTFHGKLVDRKISFHKNTYYEVVKPSVVSECGMSVVNDELISLAFLSGEFSRFRIDGNFKPDDFYNLYKKWISKSLSRDIADYVYVVKNNAKIAGMITLEKKKNIGEIGLIAVFSHYQGYGYGKELINKCIQTLQEMNIFQLNVATQMKNNQACRFYEKNGFQRESITNIYHFWL